MKPTQYLGILPLFFSLASAEGNEAETLIVSNRGDNTVQYFDTESGRDLAVWKVGVGAHEFAVSPDGKTLVGSCYGSGPGHQTPDKRLLVVQLDKPENSKLIDLIDQPRPNDLRFLDNDRVAVTSEKRQQVLVVDLNKNEVLQKIPYRQPGGHMLAIASDGKSAFVPCVPTGKVMVVSMEAGMEEPILGEIPVGAGAEGIDLSPNGRWLWVASHQSQSIAVVGYSH